MQDYIAFGLHLPAWTRGLVNSTIPLDLWRKKNCRRRRMHSQEAMYANHCLFSLSFYCFEVWRLIMLINRCVLTHSWNTDVVHDDTSGLLCVTGTILDPRPWGQFREPVGVITILHSSKIQQPSTRTGQGFPSQSTDFSTELLMISYKNVLYITLSTHTHTDIYIYIYIYI